MTAAPHHRSWRQRIAIAVALYANAIAVSLGTAWCVLKKAPWMGNTVHLDGDGRFALMAECTEYRSTLWLATAGARGLVLTPRPYRPSSQLQTSQQSLLARSNQAVFAPPASAKNRTVVMPSPALLYSVCVCNLSTRAVRISANPRLPTYWTIALYGANDDNFFVINDRKAAGKSVNFPLVSNRNGTMHDTATNDNQIVVSPSVKGSLLMRVLTSDFSTETTMVEPARRTLVCQKV